MESLFNYYMWLGHVTPNSFCAKSYDHLKFTQLHFPLNCTLIPTYGQTNGPWVHLRTLLVIRVFVREWAEGVSINGHGLRTIVWSTDRMSFRLTTLNQFSWADIFGSFWSHRRFCRIDPGSRYGPLMVTSVALAGFSEKLIFGLFSLLGVTYVRWLQ